VLVLVLGLVLVLVLVLVVLLVRGECLAATVAAAQSMFPPFASLDDTMTTRAAARLPPLWLAAPRARLGSRPSVSAKGPKWFTANVRSTSVSEAAAPAAPDLLLLLLSALPQAPSLPWVVS
jgi:hypothetical protein